MRCVPLSRKNIFEIVSETFDLQIELNRLYRLFEKQATVYDSQNRYTLKGYVKDVAFSSWRNRGRCVDVYDFLSMLDYDRLWERAKSNIMDFFTLVEIIYNFWYIADRYIHASYGYGDLVRNFVLLKKIMDDCLAHYNYKALYFHDLEQLIVIENKPEATAVAEIADQNIGHKVLRYNHYMLKGDLHAKKDILLAMGADLEPKRKQLKEIDKDLEDSIFYILNNLNLRHNNESVGDKNYRQAVVDMDDDTLENWYDELYQMMLLAYLQLDQIERNGKVKALKQLVTPK